jgi:CBS domain containing-hemolysin-like protein
VGAFLIILCLLIAFSAAFSSFETALFSLSPFQRFKLKQGGGLPERISRLLDHPRQLLTTVLLGNEVVNVAISILAANVAYHLLSECNQRTVFLISTAVTTLVLLIVGEIIPKNIAIRSPVFVAEMLILPYQLFAWLVWPFRVVFTKIADNIVRLFGADPRKGRRMIVEEELRSLLELGQKEGTLADFERKLIQNSLDFSDLKVFKIMTQRENIVAVSVTTPFPEILKTLRKKRYSRIPVFEGDVNHLIGVLHLKELQAFRLMPKEAPPLQSILKPYLEVFPEEKLDSLFEKFREARVHMGIVRDKTGKVIGLVTMDDLLRRFFSNV